MFLVQWRTQISLVFTRIVSFCIHLCETIIKSVATDEIALRRSAANNRFRTGAATRELSVTTEDRGDTSWCQKKKKKKEKKSVFVKSSVIVNPSGKRKVASSFSCPVLVKFHDRERLGSSYLEHASVAVRE